MGRAIVLLAGVGVNGEDLTLFGERVVGGNPQLKRLIIIAQRAGIEEFSILTDEPSQGLEKTLKDRRVTSQINWLKTGESFGFADEPHLVLQSNLITTPEALSRFLETPVKDNEAVSLVDKDPSGEMNGNPAVIPVGAFLVGGKALRKIIHGDFVKSLTSPPEELEISPKTVEFQNDYWMLLDEDGASSKKAEQLFYSNVSKSASGWLSKNIYIKISLPVSRMLIKTPLTPNMISALVGSIGALTGLFFIMGHPILGGVVLLLSTILDRCDGEVARVKLMETKNGQWVDTWFDQFTFISMTIGAPIGYYLQTGSPLATVLGTTNVLIQVFFVIWTSYFIFIYCKSGSMVSYMTAIDGMFPYEKRNAVVKFIHWVRPMIRRANFSPLILALAIIGGYPFVIIGTTTLLGFAFIHQLDDIIQIVNSKRAARE